MQDLEEIFNSTRTLLTLYCPPLVAKIDTSTRYDLWTGKSIEYGNRKWNDFYFAGVMTYRTYVGFYYMPIYVDPGLKSIFQPELLRLLKGKTCFHIKRLNEPLAEQIAQVLAMGIEFYRKNGWV